jgi:ABC-type lipoprotein export system ATPase subunit
MIAGLESLSGGEIQIGERVVDSVARGVFVPPEKRKLGLVFQSYALWPHLTIERNTDFGLRLRKVPRAEREQRVLSSLAKVGLADRVRHRPNELSGGPRQRVAIARALVNSPAIVLADEPTGNLDTKTGDEIMALFDELWEQGQNLIVVTHEEDVARRAHRIVRLRDGRIESDASVESLR